MIDRYEVIYREITIDDFAEIERLDAEDYCGDDPFIEEELAEMFDREDDLIKYMGYVAEFRGSIIGYLICFRPSMELANFITCIMRVFVSQDYRRIGVGTYLIENVTPSKIGHKTNIETGLEDYIAASFLRHNGFVVIGAVGAELDESGDVEMEGFLVFQNEKRPVLSLTKRLTWGVS